MAARKTGIYVCVPSWRLFVNVVGVSFDLVAPAVKLCTLEDLSAQRIISVGDQILRP